MPPISYKYFYHLCYILFCLFSDHGIFKLFLIVTNIFMLIYLKITSGRSKRCNFLSLVFSIKSISNNILINNLITSHLSFPEMKSYG